eukprot:755075-Alexandrium_andersonii.AAC.1
MYSSASSSLQRFAAVFSSTSDARKVRGLAAEPIGPPTSVRSQTTDRTQAPPKERRLNAGRGVAWGSAQGPYSVREL